MRLATTILVLALASTMLAGCGLKSEPTGGAQPYPVIVTDGAGRTVTLHSQPSRIVSLDPGLTEWLFAIGAGPRVVGRSGGERYPATALTAPIVVTHGSPDLSTIESLRPQLVLVPTGYSSQAVAQLARTLRASVYVAGSSSLQGIEHDLLSLGAVTGSADAARTVAERMQAQVARLSTLVSTLPRVRVFVDRGAFFTIAPSGLTADLIRLAGGTNAAPDATGAAHYPLRLLRTAAPQAYLVVRGVGTSLRALRASPATRGLPAVRSGDFHLIDSDALTDTGPRVTQTLHMLALTLHPDLPAYQTP
jgi:iron complex transport system substrate-binding protein